MSKLELEREISVNCFDVLGTIGLPQKREYIVFILKIAQQKGAVTAADVSQEILGNGRNSVAKRLLQQCERLQLLTRGRFDEFNLTDIGIATLETGSVYVEIESLWRIWVTEDELVRQKVLKIEEMSNSFQQNSNSEQNNNVKTEVLPLMLKELRNQILEVPFGKIPSCTINLKDKCIPKLEFTNKALLELSIDDNRGVVSLTMDGVKEQLDTHSIQRRMAVNELMRFSSSSNNWDQEYQLLKVRFRDVFGNSERSSMEKTITILKPQLEGYGQFNEISFPVSTYPETQQDTDLWADWHLSRSIVGFVIDDEYERWKNKIQERFPLGRPKFKDISDRYKEFRSEIDGKRSKEYWFLKAASDWKL